MSLSVSLPSYFFKKQMQTLANDKNDEDNRRKALLKKLTHLSNQMKQQETPFNTMQAVPNMLNQNPDNQNLNSNDTESSLDSDLLQKDDVDDWGMIDDNKTAKSSYNEPHKTTQASQYRAEDIDLDPDYRQATSNSLEYKDEICDLEIINRDQLIESPQQLTSERLLYKTTLEGGCSPDVDFSSNIAKLNYIPILREDIAIRCQVDNFAKQFFKDEIIVWCGSDFDSQVNIKRLKKLNTINRVKTFQTWYQALEYVQHSPNSLKIVASGQDAEVLVEAVFNESKVLSIYVFDDSANLNKQWVNHPKITGVEHKFETLMAKLYKDSLKVDLPAFAPVFNDNDASAMNRTHLYLRGLAQFKDFDQAKEDLVNLARKVYEDKKNMDDFVQNYTEYNETAILSWYAKQSFLHKFTNNCLRLATLDSIICSRLVIRDLEFAIREQYQRKGRHFSGLVYRGSYLTDQEWSTLKQNTGKEIEMLGFLSTSKEKEVAMRFIKRDTAKKTLITIIIPPNDYKGEQGFAEIKEFSEYEENEVLFNIRSRFTIIAAVIESIDPKIEVCRHLVLLYGAELMRLDAFFNPSIIKISVRAKSKIRKQIICTSCNKERWIRNGEKPELIFVSDEAPSPYLCFDCLKDLKGGPKLYLCFSTDNLCKGTYARRITGKPIAYEENLGIQFYGSQCIGKDHQPNKPIMQRFSCNQCQQEKKCWCADCFNIENECLKQGHSVIVESSPYTFWTESTSKKEARSFKLHKEQILDEYNYSIDFDGHYGNFELFGRFEMARGPKRDIDRIRTMDLCTTVSLIYFRSEDHLAASQSLVDALKMKRYVYGEIHSEVASVYLMLGITSRIGKKTQRATEYLNRFLDIQSLVSLKLNSDTADAYYNLALVYQDQGDYQQVIYWFSKSLVVIEKFAGVLYPNLVLIYYGLGDAYKHQNNPGKSLEFYSKAMEVSLTTYADLDTVRTESLLALNDLYKSLDDTKKSMKFYPKVLKTAIDVFQSSSNNLGNLISSLSTMDQCPNLEILNTAFALNQKEQETKSAKLPLDIEKSFDLYLDLANNHYKQKEYLEAIDLYVSILKLFQNTQFQNYHLSLVIIYSIITKICKDQEAHQKATEMHYLYIEITNVIFGEEHYNTAAAYCKLSNVYKTQQKYRMSLLTLSWALKLMKMIYGEQHCEMAILHCSIADVYEKQGKYEKSAQKYLIALEILRSFYGEANLTITSLCFRLANIYYRLKNYQKALDMYVLIIKTFREFQINYRHPDLVLINSRIAQICRELGIANKAVEIYSQFLSTSNQLFSVDNTPRCGNGGPYSGRADHDKTAMAYCGVSSAHNSEENYSKSIEFLLNALVIKIRFCKEDHHEVASLNCSIADIYSRAVKVDEVLDTTRHWKLSDKTGLIKPRDDFNFRGSNPDYEFESRYYLRKKSGYRVNPIPIYINAIEIQRRALGDTHHETIYSYYKIANAYYRVGDYQKAIDFYISIAEKFQIVSYRKRCLNLSQIYFGLAAAYDSSGDVAKALECKLKAKEIVEEEEKEFFIQFYKNNY